jgi:hypothetical protein
LYRLDSMLSLPSNAPMFLAASGYAAADLYVLAAA